MRKRNAQLDALFGRFRWYRRYIVGGHWEHWYCEFPLTEIWLPLAICSHTFQTRPAPYYRGTPTCEEWPDKGYWGSDWPLE